MVLVRPIIPPPLNVAGMYAELRGGMQVTVHTIWFDFSSTTRSWRTKVEFTREVEGFLVGRVATSNEIYGFVHDGTPPHDIDAKNAKVLAFGGGRYVAKSVPGVIGSRPGRVAGGGMVFTPHVDHPGFKGRGWAKLIANKRRAYFHRIMKAAMKRAAAASGHG